MGWNGWRVGEMMKESVEKGKKIYAGIEVVLAFVATIYVFVLIGWLRYGEQCMHCQS